MLSVSASVKALKVASVLTASSSSSTVTMTARTDKAS